MIPLGDERILLVDALELFQSQPDNDDLVISDMTMPKMTGEALARKLKEARRDIPVNLCGGFSRQLVHRYIMDLGVDGVLMKPVTLSTVANEVRGVLDK